MYNGTVRLFGDEGSSDEDLDLFEVKLVIFRTMQEILWTGVTFIDKNFTIAPSKDVKAVFK